MRLCGNAATISSKKRHSERPYFKRQPGNGQRYLVNREAGHFVHHEMTSLRLRRSNANSEWNQERWRERYALDGCRWPVAAGRRIGSDTRFKASAVSSPSVEVAILQTGKRPCPVNGRRYSQLALQISQSSADLILKSSGQTGAVEDSWERKIVVSEFMIERKTSFQFNLRLTSGGNFMLARDVDCHRCCWPQHPKRYSLFSVNGHKERLKRPPA